MKIKNKVRVGSSLYDVVIVDAPIALESAILCDGVFIADKKRIIVNSKSDLGMRTVLLHELMHAVIYEAKLNGVISSDVEEVLVEHISEFICDNFVLRFK